MNIPMKSIHDAMEAKYILNQANIRCTIAKASGETGCYYYLKIQDRHYHNAMAILNKEKMI